MEPDPLRAELARWLRTVRYVVLGIVLLTVLFFRYLVRDVFAPAQPPTAAELRDRKDARCTMVEYLRASGGIVDDTRMTRQRGPRHAGEASAA